MTNRNEPANSWLAPALIALAVLLTRTIAAAGQPYCPLQRPTLWPSDQVTGAVLIPYELQDSLTSTSLALSQAVAAWNATGLVRFYPVRLPAETTPNCARVVITERHPLNPSELRCAATPGFHNPPPYPSSFLLTAACSTDIRAFVDALIHELGHLIGLFHEHQRKDRDLFITLVPLQPGSMYSNDALCNVVKKASFDQGRPYEYLSAMHYPLTSQTDEICKPNPPGIAYCSRWTRLSKPCSQTAIPTKCREISAPTLAA